MNFSTVTSFKPFYIALLEAVGWKASCKICTLKRFCKCSTYINLLRRTRADARGVCQGHIVGEHVCDLSTESGGLFLQPPVNAVSRYLSKNTITVICRLYLPQTTSSVSTATVTSENLSKFELYMPIVYE